MSLLVNLRPQAETDIAAHSDFISNDNLEAGIRFLFEFDQTIDLLSKFPELGEVISYVPNRMRGIRVWPVHSFRSYRVFYFTTPVEIDVVRVLHSSRDFPSAFNSP